MAHEYSNAGSRSSRRGHHDEPIYNEPSGQRMPAYVEPYVTEAAEDGKSYEDDNDTQPPSHQTSQSATTEASMAPQADHNDRVSSINNVSPELLAEITERIKKEVVEHLKQASTADSNLPESQEAAPMQRGASNKTASTPSPPPTAQRVYTPPSPPQNSRRGESAVSGSPPPLNDLKSSSHSPEKAGVRYMNRPRDDSLGARSSRPVAGRTYSTAELSAIDQKWGCLIDHDGKPTLRLGQVLKGLANHIIEDFEPRKSIVVTPIKMVEYYNRYALDKEVYPFASIFRSNSSESISRLYQELGCYHHLVSPDSRKAPTIPGLTPTGFAEWMTHWILAYPDAEAARLEQVLLSLPIDADGQMVDGKPERLPKQISRYLLPSTEDSFLRHTLHEAVSACLNETESSRRPKPNTTVNPPLVRQPSVTKQPPPPAKAKPIDIPMSKPIERERMPYVNTPSLGESASIEEPFPVKIERERQPYTAMPGSGKVYNDGRTTTTINSSSSGTSRRDRANSTARSDALPTRDREEWKHVRSSSTTAGSQVPPPRPGGVRRPPSPKFTSFSQSTPLNLSLDSDIRDRDRERYERYTPSSASASNTTFTPASYATSPAFPPPPVIIDSRDRERDMERGRDTGRERERHRNRSGIRDYDRERSQGWDEDLRRYPTTGSRARRGTMEDTVPPRLATDISSPREAERWDRLQDDTGVEDYYRCGRGEYFRH